MVELKSWRNGLLKELLLTLPAEDSWEETLAQVEAVLDEAKMKASAHGAQLTLDLGVRAVALESLSDLVARLHTEYSLLTVAVVATDLQTQESARRLALNVYSMLPGTSAPIAAPEAIPGSNALYLPNTVRSGQRIDHPGTVIVGGDVNAGAEVIAEGDILVFGTLRGLAHAGSRGDEKSRIVAGNMRPQQIRIAGKIARSPEDSSPMPGARNPEIARVVNGEIQVSPA
jgi:septum site-determining protein MinC